MSNTELIYEALKENSSLISKSNELDSQIIICKKRNLYNNHMKSIKACETEIKSLLEYYQFDADELSNENLVITEKSGAIPHSSFYLRSYNECLDKTNNFLKNEKTYKEQISKKKENFRQCNDFCLDSNTEKNLIQTCLTSCVKLHYTDLNQLKQAYSYDLESRLKH